MTANLSSMFDLYFYKFIHLASLVVLAGYTFYAFVAPAETRKPVLMITGIAALLMLVSGAALVTKAGHLWSEKWIWVKLVCWLGIAAMSGIAYRRREIVPKLKLATLGLFAVALFMVVYRWKFM